VSVGAVMRRWRIQDDTYVFTGHHRQQGRCRGRLQTGQMQPADDLHNPAESAALHPGLDVVGSWIRLGVIARDIAVAVDEVQQFQPPIRIGHLAGAVARQQCAVGANPCSGGAQIRPSGIADAFELRAAVARLRISAGYIARIGFVKLGCQRLGQIRGTQQ
jgi:hypothetical protein